MICPHCNIEMGTTYEPYEYRCEKCGYWFDTYTGKEVTFAPPADEGDYDDDDYVSEWYDADYTSCMCGFCQCGNSVLGGGICSDCYKGVHQG